MCVQPAWCSVPEGSVESSPVPTLTRFEIVSKLKSIVQSVANTDVKIDSNLSLTDCLVEDVFYDAFLLKTREAFPCLKMSLDELGRANPPNSTIWSYGNMIYEKCECSSI